MSHNQTARYLKYAIGEIILVVIGILIALQINNWNEGRKEQKHQIKLISQLLEDAKIDSVFYDTRITLFSGQLKSYDLLNRFCSAPNSNPELDSIVLTDNVPFKVAASQSNIMSNKNEYSKITDEVIKKTLRDYTISYSFISKAIEIHTETISSEITILIKKYNLKFNPKSTRLSHYEPLKEEKNIKGILELCRLYTDNARSQTERFIIDNQTLIKACKTYLDR